MSSSSLRELQSDAPAITKQSSASVTSSLKQPSLPIKHQHPLDAKLDRLTRDVLPSAPYLLRLRDRSAQYHIRDRYYWKKDTHFNEDEEELQYLTFRQTHDGTILHAHGQWDDGSGGIAQKEFPSSQTSSGQTPLAGQAAKKKISLADYKKLDKTKPRTSDMSTTAVKEPFKRSSQEMSEMRKMEAEKTESEVKGRIDTNVKTVETQKRATEPVRKRLADEMTGEKDAIVLEQGPSTPPAKKSRPTVEPVKNELAKIEHVHPRGVQPAMSSSTAGPVSQEREKSSSKEEKASISKGGETPAYTSSVQKGDTALLHGLPPMLSPTLPAEIEEELAKLTPGIRGGLVSSRVSSASPSVHIKDHKHPVSASGQMKATSSGPAPSTSKPRPHDLKQITSAPRQQHDDQASHVNAGSFTPTKKSKIVKLKIRNKGNRRTLMQYLRMKPTPNRGSQHVASKSTSAEATSYAKASKIAAQSKPSRKIKPSRQDESSDTDEPLARRKSKKRHASELEGDDFERRDVKRGRGSGQQQRERTLEQSQSSRQVDASNQNKHPVKATVSTPTQSLPGSAQKTHLNIMSSTMQRTGSQESVATPARDITPTANGHKTESPERREWKKEVKIEISRLLKLATEIKHDSDAFLKHLKGEDYEEHREIGSVIATEAVLCFVLAAMVSDEPGRSSHNPSNTDLWKSTRDFTASLSSIHARKFQYLFGLLKQLEGLVCDTLTYQHDMRGEAILREYNRLKGQEAVAATPNADSYIAENWTFLKEAQETRLRSRTAWREGQHALFDPELERQFPKTWSRRRAFPSRGKGRDPVSLNNYAKEGFALPLGINSTGLDAVNFGLSFLAELCEKDGLQWEPKLVL